MKIFRNLTNEENLIEFMRTKSLITIGLYIITIIQVLQELFPSIIWDYIVLIVTFSEVLMFFLSSIIINRLGNDYDGINVKKYELLSEMHSVLITSMIVPMVFMFDSNNTEFSNFIITDVEIIKKITVLVGLVDILLYNLFMKLVVNKYKKEQDSIADEDLLKKKRMQHSRRLLYMNLFLYLLAYATVFASMVLLIGYGIENVIIVELIFCSFLLVIALVAVPYFFKDSRKIIRVGVIIFSVVFLCYSIKSVYNGKSMQPYNFGNGAYYGCIEYSEGKYADVHASFEINENGDNCLKLMVSYQTDERSMLLNGTAECRYKAYKCLKFFDKWRDSQGENLELLKTVGKSEFPVILLHSGWTTDSDEGFNGEEITDKFENIYAGENYKTKEVILIGDGYIRFRNLIMNKINYLN